MLGQNDGDVLEQGREYETSNLGGLISNLEKEIRAVLQEKRKLTRILKEKDLEIERLRLELNSSRDNHNNEADILQLNRIKEENTKLQFELEKAKLDLKARNEMVNFLEGKLLPQYPNT